MLRMLPSHKNFRGKDLRITDPTELDIAESKLIHRAQMESFPVELKTLTAGKPINNSSKIATYSPFIGPAGIIRSIGRIMRLVNTEFYTKQPILLDARHNLVHFLARSLHHKHFHQGLDYMRSVLNLKHAILGLRRLLRSMENQCLTCRKRQASTIQPIMSDLPVERLGYKQPPFNHTGVNYFGPLYVPVRRSTEKRWGFLFTCLPPGLYTLRLYHLWTPVLVSWAMNGSLRVMVRQARSGRITARTSLVRKRNYLPVSRAGMAWLRTFLHTKVLLGNLTRQAHPIMAAHGNVYSEA